MKAELNEMNDIDTEPGKERNIFLGGREILKIINF